MKTRFTLYHAVVGGAYVVFICNMIISYYHAWELFSRIGDYPGKLPHVAVVAFDTVFALTILVISTGIMKKVPIGLPVWLAGAFGLLMTSWSNVRASMGSEWMHFVSGDWGRITSQGWESLVAGISTPTALVAIEFLLAWMVANRELFQAATRSDKAISQPANVPEPHTEQIVQIEQENHTPEPETGHRTLFEPDSIPDTIQENHTPYTEQTIQAEQENRTPKPGTKTEHAIQCASRLIEEGKKPSIRKLAEIADCSNSTAQQALKILRDQRQTA